MKPNGIKRVTVLMDNTKYEFVIGQPANLDLNLHDMGGRARPVGAVRNPGRVLDVAAGVRKT